MLIRDGEKIPAYSIFCRQMIVIKEKSDLRRLINVATKIYESSQNGDTSVAEIANNA